MKRTITVFVYLLLLFNPCFHSYASEHLIAPEENEYLEILSAKEDVLYHINYGGARTELDRDVEADEVEMDRAYRIYANSDLLKSRDIREALENSHYIWQVPVYVDNCTILVDITKVTSISEDIPEDAKEMLKDDLNRWTVGATYIYTTETVDYDANVTQALERAGYNSDEYTYEIVSGIPGIRYPAAIVFDMNEEPEFVIPAQKATTHAFDGEWPTAAGNDERDASPSSVLHDGTTGGMPVYYFDDVKRASDSYNKYGMGGAGLTYKAEKSLKEKAVLSVGSFTVLLLAIRIGLKKNRA